MLGLPGLVESREHVPGDDGVAHVAEVPEQLVVVGLAVGQALALVVPVAKEGLLALGADKVLDTPVLAQGRHHPALDGPPAGATDGDAHPVVTSEAVELVELLRGVARPRLDLPGTGGQLLPASGAVKVIGAVVLAPEPQGLTLDGGVALLTHVLAHPSRFDLQSEMNNVTCNSSCFSHLGIALVAQRPALVLDEAEVGQLLVAHLAAEALRVPGGAHGL